MSVVFDLVMPTVIPFWILMIAAPRGQLTSRLLSSPWIVIGPLLLYTWVVLPELATIVPVVARPSFGPVVALLGTETGTAASWAHFLGFDLFVGRFIVLDSRERAIPTWTLSIVLLITLMVAPIGLLIYLTLRAELPGKLRGLWRMAYQSSRSLSVLGLLTLSAAAVTGTLMQLDTRMLHGAPLWLKPTKFGLSFSIGAFTFAYLLRAVVLPTRVRKWLIGTIVWMSALELAIVIGQAARGVASHFNVSSPLNTALWATMGVAIVILTAAQAWIGVYAFRTKYLDAALGAGVRYGVVIMIVGSCVAFLMPSPSATQLDNLLAGQATPVVGSHMVGGADDLSQGMPLTRWSTTGGDLRVPHFVGLHALQLLPLAGVVLGRRLRTRPKLALGLTRALSLGYLGVFLTTLVQALRGQPMLAPDTVTLAMFAGVVGASTLTALALIARSYGLRALTGSRPARRAGVPASGIR